VALSEAARAASAADLAAAASRAAASAVACAASTDAWLAQPEATLRTSTMAPTFNTFLIIVQISSVGIKLHAHYFLKSPCPQRNSLFFLVFVGVRRHESRFFGLYATETRLRRCKYRIAEI
jgi:hypothetical protein